MSPRSPSRASTATPDTPTAPDRAPPHRAGAGGRPRPAGGALARPLRASPRDRLPPARQPRGRRGPRPGVLRARLPLARLLPRRGQLRRLAAAHPGAPRAGPLPQPAPAGTGAARDELAGAAREPHGRAEARELARSLADALGALAAPLRVALLLRTREGLEYAEIGTLTGVTAETARTRVMKARKRLHERIASAFEDGEDGR